VGPRAGLDAEFLKSSSILNRKGELWKTKEETREGHNLEEDAVFFLGGRNLILNIV
jgi:hypothetical protein